LAARILSSQTITYAPIENPVIESVSDKSNVSIHLIRVIDILDGRKSVSAGLQTPHLEAVQAIEAANPLIVIRSGKSYSLLSDQRSFQALKELGLQRVPALVLNDVDPTLAELCGPGTERALTASEVVLIKSQIAISRIGHRPSSSKKGVNSPPFVGKSRSLAAVITGWSTNSISKAERLVRAAKQEPEKWGDKLSAVDRNDLSLDSAVKDLDRAENAKGWRETLLGRSETYGLVYVAPDWERIAWLENRTQIVALQKFKQLRLLALPGAKDAIVVIRSRELHGRSRACSLKILGSTLSRIPSHNRIKGRRHFCPKFPRDAHVYLPKECAANTTSYFACTSKFNIDRRGKGRARAEQANLFCTREDFLNYSWWPDCRLW